MILAEMNWLTITTNLLIVVDVLVCLLLCLVVLMQRPKQEGLGAAFGGGMTDQAFGARTTDVLQKGTVYLGTAFFVITFALSILTSAPTYAEQGEQKLKDEAAKVEKAKDDQLDSEDNQNIVNTETTPESKPDATPAEQPAEEATPVAPVEETPAEQPAPAEETPAPAEEPSTEQPAGQEPQADGQ